MNEPNYLLAAIERLTLPHRTLVAQANEAGISCVSTVEHEALLKALKGAIGGNVGRYASGQQAREKTPLNLAAFEKFKVIAAQVEKWRAVYEQKRRPVYEELWIALGRWYLLYENDRRKGRVSRDTEVSVERTVIGWVREIDNMFDPPNVFEITKESNGRDTPERCPICFEQFAHDPKTGDRVTALITEYRNLGNDTLTFANSHCRFCGHVWPGLYGIRALKYELEHPSLSPAEMAVVERFGMHEPEHADEVSHEPV